MYNHKQERGLYGGFCKVLCPTVEFEFARIIVTRHLGSSSDLKVPTANFAGISDYSTSEVDTGYKWIDGKTIYKKTISVGPLPNTTTKSVATGISGTIDRIISLSGWATAGTVTVPLPHASITSNQIISLTRSGTDISLTSGLDRSAFTEAYVTLYYTKT